MKRRVERWRNDRSEIYLVFHAIKRSTKKCGHCGRKHLIRFSFLFGSSQNWLEMLQCPNKNDWKLGL